MKSPLSLEPWLARRSQLAVYTGFGFKSWLFRGQGLVT